MKTKIEIKNWLTGGVIFSFEKENNTIKDTVEEAAKSGANLRGANLGRANLGGANLYGANLGGANLGGANLYGADLGDANLYGADLYGADLRGADLYGADLRRADLRRADLHSANLYGANLGGADLRGANLRGAESISFIPLACPSDGAFVGWKKVKNTLVKLLVPEDARRSSATTNKCRCDKAKVLEITSPDGTEHLDEVINDNYVRTIYRVGEMVYPDSFDEDRWNECTNGIHFFINKQEAIDYV